MSRDSAISIATGYWLDDRGVGVRVPVGSRIFNSPCRPERLWGPPNLLSKGYGGSFPGGKAAWAWSWPHTSNKCRGQGNVDLYIHSPIRLHGVVLNLLSTETTLPFLPFIRSSTINTAWARPYIYWLTSWLYCHVLVTLCHYTERLVCDMRSSCLFICNVCGDTVKMLVPSPTFGNDSEILVL
jgi:hypothetical protein